MNSYFVGDRVIGQLGQKMGEAGLRGRAFLVSDERVFPIHGPKAMAGLSAAGFQPESLVLPAGEPTKALQVTYRIYEWLASHRAERTDNVVALGGGVIGDVAGFAAATYLRGLPLVQSPTTLLAMIDSAIGGKVAVNLPQGKNLVGAFHQPSLIFADVDTLRSLPRREIAAGWAEAVKCAMILDEGLLGILEKEASGLLDLSSPRLVEVIERCAQHKIKVVEQDERETGLRMILNYGHTIGHALEASLGYGELLHGEAVAVGMAGAALIAKRLNLLDGRTVDRQEAALRAFGLPTRLPAEMRDRIVLDGIFAAMALDKKVRDKAIRWVLLEGIGKTRIESSVPADLVREVIGDLMQPAVASAR